MEALKAFLKKCDRPAEATWLSVRPRLATTGVLLLLSLGLGATALFGITAFVPVIYLMGRDDAAGATELPLVDSLVEFLGGYGPDTFYWLVGILLLLGLTKAVLEFTYQYFLQQIKLFVIADWQRRVIFKWVNAPYEQHSREGSANVLNLTANEVSHMGNSISSVITGVGAILQIGLALAFLAAVSITALSGLIVALLVVALPMLSIAKRLFSAAAKEAEGLRGYTERVHDIVKRIELVDLFKTWSHEESLARRSFGALIRSKTRLYKLRLLAPLSIQMSLTIIVSGLIIFLFETESGSAATGAFLMFIGGLIVIQPQLQNLVGAMSEFIRIGAAYNQMLAVLKLPDRPAATPSFRMAGVAASRGKIEVRDLSFSYRSEKETVPVLRDATVTLKAAGLYMVFGETGAGKTTFLRLLQGLLKPDEGTVLIDGVRVETLDHEEMVRKILMMPQDQLVFTGTVRENIEYGRDAVDNARIERAMHLAGADAFATKLPNGIDTDIGRDGALLSGGQRQRIALARIIAAAPDIMLFDEPTSALDRHMESRIMNSLDALCAEGHTVIMSTHKVDLAPLADELLWFSDGTIAQGTYDDFSSILAETHCLSHRRLRARIQYGTRR